MEIAILILLVVVVVLLVIELVVNASARARQPDIDKTLSRQRQELTLTLESFGKAQERQLTNLTAMTEKRLEAMRETVDEKLQTSLERRLHESFKQVSERLEMVYKGLGEMQTLATGVGDLKKVLSNVKVRGPWGEVQLGNLLAQFLAASDFVENVVTKKTTRDRVEFAIKLPSKTDDERNLLLPIDAKFPLDDYERWQQASEAADKVASEAAYKALCTRLKKCAQDISVKYLDPPATTDFAIMYLPLEGLYALVSQDVELIAALQRDYRVTVMGPNTIAAFLSSLQLGFRTLTIEKRSAQVWQLLGEIQTEFATFGTILQKTQKKLQEASDTIAKAQSKSTTITRKLAKVEMRDLPESKSQNLLGE